MDNTTPEKMRDKAQAAIHAYEQGKGLIDPQWARDMIALLNWQTVAMQAQQETHAAEIGALQLENENLQTICAAAYQMAGALNAPVRFLDVLANPLDATSEEIDALLPIRMDEEGVWDDEARDARVRQETIEECAKVCDNQARLYAAEDDMAIQKLVATLCAKAIRSLPPAAKINQNDTVHLAVHLAGIPSLPSNGSVPNDAYIDWQQREGVFLRKASEAGAEAILYTDEINGQQVCRDDVWKITSSQIIALCKSVAALSTTGSMLRSTRQDAHDEGQPDEQNASSAAQPTNGAASGQDDLSDEEIEKVLHSLGIDTYPSKYGFPEKQVSATCVPRIREIVAAYQKALGRPASTVPTTQVPGFVTVEFPVIPESVVQSGLRTYQVMKDVVGIDDASLVLVVYRDMLLAGDRSPKVAASAAPSNAGVLIDADELRRAILGIRVAGEIDGYGVVRRNSVMDIIQQRKASAAPSTADQTEREAPVYPWHPTESDHRPKGADK